MKRDIQWLLGPKVYEEMVEVLDSDDELDYEDLPPDALPQEFPGVWSRRQLSFD